MNLRLCTLHFASSTHVQSQCLSLLLLCRYHSPDDTSFSCRTNNEQTQTVSRACAIIIVHYVPRDQSTRCGKKKNDTNIIAIHAKGGITRSYYTRLKKRERIRKEFKLVEKNKNSQATHHLIPP